MKAVGIDLGTTYSAVAVVRNGVPELLMNYDGGYLTPSVVLFQPGAEPLVGELAARSAAEAPHECVQFVKRHLGDPHWSVVDAAGEEYRPEQISAMILKRLVRDAAAALGEPVVDAVITVPAYFDDVRRTATRQAGEIAGLNVLRLVNEPTAAAVAYGLGEAGRTGTYFVYDLGGGTFDVTVLRHHHVDAFRVMATEGDRNLGGFDFDNELMKHVARVIRDEPGPDVLDDAVLAADLRGRCELAKRRLSVADQAVVVLTAAGRTFRVTVTRAEFEAMTRDLLERTEIIAEGVLADAGVTWAQIDQVLLVGGSTRMPMVRELVRRMSGRTPVAGVHPDEAVALGAAIMADQLGAGQPRVTIEDVTSQSLGTTVVDDLTTYRRVNDILIPRNTRLPCRVERLYGTVVPDQRAIYVDITEGEGSDPELVTKLIERDIHCRRVCRGMRRSATRCATT
jgi:molecular chaperone DnaK